MEKEFNALFTKFIIHNKDFETFRNMGTREAFLASLQKPESMGGTTIVVHTFTPDQLKVLMEVPNTVTLDDLAVLLDSWSPKSK